MLTPSKEVPSRKILRHLWHRLKRVHPNLGKIKVVGAGKFPYFQSGLFCLLYKFAKTGCSQLQQRSAKTLALLLVVNLGLSMPISACSSSKGATRHLTLT